MYEVGDTFEGYTSEAPFADDVISGLEVYLVPSGSFSINQAVASSNCVDCTLNHIFFPIQDTDDYEIWVREFDSDAGSREYGLAWWYGLAPDIIAGTPGDFDGDGDVDAADLAQWQGDFGANGDSDADNDGDTDGADFLAWQRNFGATSLSASTAVPEPSCLLLLALGLPMLLSNRHDRVLG